MEAFIKIPKKSILFEGVTTDPKFCECGYVVYRNDNDEIHVNTFYKQSETETAIEVCRHYDRKLCDSSGEYERIDKTDVEGQAYGSYMDGAR